MVRNDEAPKVKEASEAVEATGAGASEGTKRTAGRRDRSKQGRDRKKKT